jgi:hypothetical protein
MSNLFQTVIRRRPRSSSVIREPSPAPAGSERASGRTWICSTLSRTATRATLTAHVEELIDTLVRREARHFEPIIPVGTSFGVRAALTVVMVLGADLPQPLVAARFTPHHDLVEGTHPMSGHERNLAEWCVAATAGLLDWPFADDHV